MHKNSSLNFKEAYNEQVLVHDDLTDSVCHGFVHPIYSVAWGHDTANSYLWSQGGMDGAQFMFVVQESLTTYRWSGDVESYTKDNGSGNISPSSHPSNSKCSLRQEENELCSFLERIDFYPDEEESAIEDTTQTA
jgi:hypothetical protein